MVPPMRRLVVRRVRRAVVWARGGGVHRCCVRGLVMGFPLVALGGGVRRPAHRRGAGAVGVGGCLRIVSRCSRPGGEAGGACRGGTAGGGWGCVLCSLGVWVSRQALWMVCVCVWRIRWAPAGLGVEVGGCCLGF